MADTVVIAGASGVVGVAAVEEFLENGWNVVAISRRSPEVKSKRSFRHLALDLRDATACRAAIRDLGAVTHVIYAALFEKPGLIAGWQESDQMETNLKMLQNLLEPLMETASLQHVSLLQGTKAYGIHLHPMPIPARERAPRDNHANFYWLQEDYLKEKSTERGFKFTIFRPQLIIGASYNVAMNLAPVIGAYAAICQELGETFGFPGGVSYVWEAVDARLLAKVFRWATATPAAASQHFNVTNGDVFEWRNLWPALASTLGVDVGPDKPRQMSTWLIDHAHVWDRIVVKHGLRKTTIAEICGESHHYADFCFAYGATEPPPAVFVSTIKLRQAGFTEVQDTEEMFTYWLNDLIDRKILPRGAKRAQ